MVLSTWSKLSIMVVSSDIEVSPKATFNPSIVCFKPQVPDQAIMHLWSLSTVIACGRGPGDQSLEVTRLRSPRPLVTSPVICPSARRRGLRPRAWAPAREDDVWYPEVPEAFITPIHCSGISSFATSAVAAMHAMPST
jgi:hypothetical protein